MNKNNNKNEQKRSNFFFKFNIFKKKFNSVKVFLKEAGKVNGNIFLILFSNNQKIMIFSTNEVKNLFYLNIFY